LGNAISSYGNMELKNKINASKEIKEGIRTNFN
jgi:hypothetical protein